MRVRAPGMGERRLSGLLAALVAAALATHDPPAMARALPERIVLMWQVTGDSYAADMPRLASLGVNTVQSFPLARQKPGYITGYLDAAARAGLGVMPFLGRDGEGAGCRLSAVGEGFIRQYAAHPAIAAWHSIDEPANGDVSKECQRKVYVRIKELDHAHPVMLSTNITKQEQYERYFAEDAFDVLALHRYVNPGIGKGQRELLQRFRENRQRDYPVIVTLRAFNSPKKVLRWDMRPGSLAEQYEFFLGKDKVSDNVAFYGWRLSPNVGISQIDWLRTEFEALARQKLARNPPT